MNSLRQRCYRIKYLISLSINNYIPLCEITIRFIQDCGLFVVRFRQVSPPYMFKLFFSNINMPFDQTWNASLNLITKSELHNGNQCHLNITF
jgi:hypothetical protein